MANRDSATDFGLLFVRLAIGVVFFAHGGQKLFGWFGGYGMTATVAAFHHLGISAFMAHVVALVEWLGGIAMILGLLSRTAGIFLALDMLGAIVKVHLANGFFSTGPKPGFEFPLVLLATSLLIVLAGPGRIALADFEGRPTRRRVYST